MAGNHEQAQRAYEESLALFEKVSDERDVAVLIHRLGSNALNLGRPELAREPLERSLRMFRRIGSARGMAQAIGGLGYLEQREGHVDQAVKLWTESLEMVRDTGFIWWEAGMLSALAEAAVEEGRYHEAAARAREQLLLSGQVADRQQAVYALASLARAVAELGDAHRAGVVWGSIEAEESRAAVGVWESERDQYESHRSSPMRGRRSSEAVRREGACPSLRPSRLRSKGQRLPGDAGRSRGSTLEGGGASRGRDRPS